MNFYQLNEQIQQEAFNPLRAIGRWYRVGQKFGVGSGQAGKVYEDELTQEERDEVDKIMYEPGFIDPTTRQPDARKLGRAIEEMRRRKGMRDPSKPGGLETAARVIGR